MPKHSATIYCEFWCFSAVGGAAQTNNIIHAINKTMKYKEQNERKEIKDYKIVTKY